MDTVPHHAKVPAPALYRGIASQLSKDIAGGTWRPGEQIPTEIELAERFGVSQGTMRLAVLELVKAGLLSRRQGKGTFVNAMRLDQSLERFFRYERRDAGNNLTPETLVLGVGEVVADAQTREALGVVTRRSVGWLRRLRRQDGEAFLLHDSYFPIELWADIQANCELGQPNLYRQLQRFCDTPMLRADEYLSARLSTADESQVLEIPEASAVVHLERHAYTFSDRKVEFRRSVGRGDRFSYHVQL